VKNQTRATKRIATNYPLPNLGFLIHQQRLQSNASGTPCAKNVAGGAEELPFPMASAGHKRWMG